MCLPTAVFRCCVCHLPFVLANLGSSKPQPRACAAYGTIEYRPDDDTRPDVHGVVLDLSEEEMKRLAAIEGGYDIKDVLVTGDDGTRYRSKAFVTNWSVRLFDEGKPTHDYIGKLRTGAQQHSLPPEYQVCTNTLLWSNPVGFRLHFQVHTRPD